MKNRSFGPAFHFITEGRQWRIHTMPTKNYDLKKQVFQGLVWRGGYQVYHHAVFLLVKLI